MKQLLIPALRAPIRSARFCDGFLAECFSGTILMNENRMEWHENMLPDIY